jgi:tight adherence protein C
LVTIAVVGFLAWWAPALTAGAVVGSVVFRRVRTIRRRRAEKRRMGDCLPDAIDLLVLSIRAGWLPAAAIAEIEPHVDPCLRQALNAVTAAMSDGARFADALQHLVAGWGPPAHSLVDSLAAADRYGLPLAPVLERLAGDAKQQRQRDADAAARELPVRLTVPLVLCTLPSYVLIAIAPLLLGAFASLRL